MMHRNIYALLTLSIYACLLTGLTAATAEGPKGQKDFQKALNELATQHLDTDRDEELLRETAVTFDHLNEDGLRILTIFNTIKNNQDDLLNSNGRAYLAKNGARALAHCLATNSLDLNAKITDENRACVKTLEGNARGYSWFQWASYKEASAAILNAAEAPASPASTASEEPEPAPPATPAPAPAPELGNNRLEEAEPAPAEPVVEPVVEPLDRQPVVTDVVPDAPTGILLQTPAQSASRYTEDQEDMRTTIRSIAEQGDMNPRGYLYALGLTRKPKKVPAEYDADKYRDIATYWLTHASTYAAARSNREIAVHFGFDTALTILEKDPSLKNTLPATINLTFFPECNEAAKTYLMAITIMQQEDPLLRPLRLTKTAEADPLHVVEHPESSAYASDDDELPDFSQLQTVFYNIATCTTLDQFKAHILRRAPQNNLAWIQAAVLYADAHHHTEDTKPSTQADAAVLPEGVTSAQLTATGQRIENAFYTVCLQINDENNFLHALLAAGPNDSDGHNGITSFRANCKALAARCLLRNEIDLVSKKPYPSKTYALEGHNYFKGLLNSWTGFGPGPTEEYTKTYALLKQTIDTPAQPKTPQQGPHRALAPNTPAPHPAPTPATQTIASPNIPRPDPATPPSRQLILPPSNPDDLAKETAEYLAAIARAQQATRVQRRNKIASATMYTGAGVGVAGLAWLLAHLLKGANAQRTEQFFRRLVSKRYRHRLKSNVKINGKEITKAGVHTLIAAALIAGGAATAAAGKYMRI